MAGAEDVVVRAAGDGTMVPIEYTITFDDQTMSMLQYID